MNADRPLLALTLGDIAGIGPEVVAKALADDAVREQARLAVFGPLRPLRRQLIEAGADLPLERVESDALREWDFAQAIPVVDDVSVKAPCCNDVRGQVSAASGGVSHAAVLAAADACLTGLADGMVTAPIHKEAWAAAGASHPGHTEALAERCGVTGEVMLFVSPALKVALATIHVPLAKVPSLITPERLRHTIDLTAAALPLLGALRARIAVAGLNPHAGEGGLFGDEEIKIIAPAVEKARAEGLDVSGPYPGDTVFARARRGEFDAVIALYHDQGLCAVKTLDFEHAVNITLGLPIIRTSVDHGTAFDIAGKGVADATSMREAIRWAATMALHRSRQSA